MRTTERPVTMSARSHRAPRSRARSSAWTLNCRQSPTAIVRAAGVMRSRSITGSGPWPCRTELRRRASDPLSGAVAAREHCPRRVMVIRDGRYELGQTLSVATIISAQRDRQPEESMSLTGIATGLGELSVVGVGSLVIGHRSTTRRPRGDGGNRLMARDPTDHALLGDAGFSSITRLAERP